MLAKSLANDIFECYRGSPLLQRDFKLWDQMNGASGSIMDNIAEGFERSSRNEFINFLSYAKGSAGELKSQLYRAESRKYFSKVLFDELYEKTDKVGRKIGSYMRYLNRTTYKGTKFKERYRESSNAKPETRNAE
jgi:four helix bundle protein